MLSLYPRTFDIWLVNWETAAQELGYGSFADAVAAYNTQYGTS